MGVRAAGVGVDWQHGFGANGQGHGQELRGALAPCKSCKCQRTNSNNNKRNWIGMTTAGARNLLRFYFAIYSPLPPPFSTSLAFQRHWARGEVSQRMDFRAANKFDSC